MTLGSLFDGIGGWQLAAVRAGIQPLWSSEINKFCCTVTHRHFPNTIQLGDINLINDAPKVDIITASSPCQDLSIAGKQGGIHCARSGLFFKAVELVRRLKPRFFVWENVAGALSSNKGSDFHAVLQEILQEPVPLPRYFSNAGLVDGRHCQIAWRVLDAQFHGVAQRRRRIFLVADFTGRRAAEILFERKSLQKDFETCRFKGRDTASTTSRRPNCSIGFNAWSSVPCAGYELAPTQRTNNAIGVTYSLFDMTHADEVLRPVHSDKANCLNSRMGTGGNQIQLVAFGIGRDAFNQGANAKFKPTIEPDLQPPLTARGAAAVATNIIRRLTPVECERLQGLPDNFSAGGSDTQRYKALGNGLAQPCADFILRRIKEVCL